MNKVDRKPEGESARLPAQKGPGTLQVIAAVRLVPPRTGKVSKMVTPCTYGSEHIRAHLSTSLDLSGITLRPKSLLHKAVQASR